MAGLADVTGVGARLVRLRTAFGVDSQFAMARAIGVRYETYHHAEKTGMLGKEMAFAIVARFPGVTLDWLYLGRATHLPPQLAMALTDDPRHAERPSVSEGPRQRPRKVSKTPE